jgi:tetrapyrrole methylase family protein/MazG family protein
MQKLFDLIATLRGENGCPWDREQKSEDILSDLIEEVYELQWAHAQGGDHEVLDEMGDVVFVLAFAIALIRERDAEFTLERITRHAYDKIKGRHPHVFGNEVANTKEEGLAHWERMKSRENSGKSTGQGRFDDVPGVLPPLRRAEKIQKRAARAGFDWSDTSGIFEKIREEVDELEAVVHDGAKDRTTEEVGDILFSLVNLTRFLHIDAEKALTSTNAKFVDRFQKMETLITADNRTLSEMTLEEMDVYWERAKRSLGA